MQAEIKKKNPNKTKTSTKNKKRASAAADALTQIQSPGTQSLERCNFALWHQNAGRNDRALPRPITADGGLTVVVIVPRKPRSLTVPLAVAHFGDSVCLEALAPICNFMRTNRSSGHLGIDVEIPRSLEAYS